MMEKPNIHKMRQHCPSYRYSYALLDCAIDDQLYPAITRSNCEYSTLFWSGASETLKAASPHIVRLYDDGFASWLFNEGWGKSWGIFLVSNKPIDDLVRHFRRLAKVRGPNNENWYFRYCDPRFMRVLLPTCDQAQLARIMGEAGMFWMEDGEPGYANCYQRVGRMLQVTRRTLDSSVSEQHIYDPESQLRSDTSPNGFRVRRDQCDHLVDVVRATFIREMVDVFMYSYPKKLKIYSPEYLGERIDIAIDEMHKVGAQARRDAYYFVNTCILYGWDFMNDSNHEWIRKDYLENDSLGTISHRLEALFYYCRSQPIMDEMLEA